MSTSWVASFWMRLRVSENVPSQNIWSSTIWRSEPGRWRITYGMRSSKTQILSVCIKKSVRWSRRLYIVFQLLLTWLFLFEERWRLSCNALCVLSFVGFLHLAEAGDWHLAEAGVFTPCWGGCFWTWLRRVFLQWHNNKNHGIVPTKKRKRIIIRNWYQSFFVLSYFRILSDTFSGPFPSPLSPPPALSSKYGLSRKYQ